MAKKKTPQWRQYLMFIGFVLIGAFCGVLMAQYVDRLVVETGVSSGQSLMMLAVLFVCMYVAIFLQIVIHEAGHLVFGLATGYQFSSFRIGNFMWMKDGGKLVFKRMSLAGTGGQCLMCPPDLIDGKIPYVLYNLGGSLLNLISALLFVLLWYLTKNMPIVPVVCLMFAVIGVAYALMNGIPMRLGAVDNDGYNALSLSKSPAALRSFWIQMKANEQLAKGVSILDMPADWFTPPSDDEMRNSMTAVMGVFACNRLMTEKRFSEALQLMRHYLEIETAIVGLHRNLLICDIIYCELVGGADSSVVSALLTKEQKQFMKTMRKYPTVLRTEYTCALLDGSDPKKAEDTEQQFERIAKTYPYASDIANERELMQYAKARASEKRGEEA